MSTEKVVRYTAEQLDKYAVNNAIERMPFNPHEKSSDETRRRVLALAYKDGWRACEKHMEADVTGLVEALKEIEKVCAGQTRGIVVHIDRIANKALARFQQ